MKKEGRNSADLLTKSVNYAFSKSIPLITTFEITQVCNLKCSHCYNYDRSKPMPKEVKDRSLEPHEIVSAIDELAELGCLYLNISGGEALVHPHLFDFIKRARNNKIEVRLKSNGILLTDKKISDLLDAEVRSFDISLYGSRDETYLKFTGMKEGFQKSYAGIANLARLNTQTNINIILHRYNVSELPEMIALCQKLGLPYQISTEVTERYDGTKGARDFEITPEQFEELLLGDYGHHFMTNNEEKSLQCSCARSVCGINSMGDVFPCIGAPIKSGNIREDKLENIWKNSSELNSIRSLKTSDFKDCMSCDYIEYCDRSSGSCYVNSGKYTGCDESLLSQAKTRFKHKEKF